MENKLIRYFNQYNGSYFDLIINLIIMLCVISLFVAIALNFKKSKAAGEVKKEKKSIVETGTMTGFFIFFYLLIRSEFGVIEAINGELRMGLMVLGTLIIITGCVFNIMGRLYLGSNWGNQIRIYNDHTLVKEGPYGIVRHPLYASIIWMFFGAGLVYVNYMAVLANLLIFIPFMYYRAKQEEGLLEKQFDDYRKYMQNTGMFFPKI